MWWAHSYNKWLYLATFFAWAYNTQYFGSCCIVEATKSVCCWPFITEVFLERGSTNVHISFRWSRIGEGSNGGQSSLHVWYEANLCGEHHPQVPPQEGGSLDEDQLSRCEFGTLRMYVDLRFFLNW